MKQYDRETKQWLDAEEVEHKHAKRKACKGGKEHDWILCLPYGVRDQDSVLGLDKIEEYYKIQDEREDAEIAFDERLEALGIKTFSFRFGKLLGRHRSYICSVCMKRK